MSLNEQSPSQILVGATLIDGARLAPITDSSIVVGNGRILNVGTRDSVKPPSGADLIDLSGFTVIPGLFDSHVHVGQIAYNRFAADDPEQLFDDFMKSFVARGVTTVRCTGSPDLGKAFTTLKEGRPDWPRFFGSGPNLDGSPGGPHTGLRVINTPEEAITNVRDLLDHGADFIKVYAWMEQREMAAVVEEAHRRGARVAAHVGHSTTASEAVSLGVDCLEHIRIGHELLTDDQRQQLKSMPKRQHDALISFRPWQFIDLDSRQVDTLLEQFTNAQVRIVPTLTLSQSVLLSRIKSEVRTPPGIDTMHEAVIRRWEESEFSADYSDSDLAYAEGIFLKQLDFVRRVHEAGIRVIAGTDVPNPYIPPGYGLHQELQLLVAAGISPLQALMSSTSRAAELLGLSHELGSIEGGKHADLVVLDGNPTSDISMTERIAGVMKAGHWVCPLKATS